MDNEKEVLIEVVEKDNSLLMSQASEMSVTLEPMLERLETGKHIRLSINDETSVKEKLG